MVKDQHSQTVKKRVSVRLFIFKVSLWVLSIVVCSESGRGRHHGGISHAPSAIASLTGREMRALLESTVREY